MITLLSGGRVQIRVQTYEDATKLPSYPNWDHFLATRRECLLW